MFNPYREWLGIPEDQQPPHLYQLLGIQPFETDAEVISRAADRVMLYVRTFQTGPYSDVSQKLLNEISKARVTLLSPESKDKYDSRLRHKLRKKSSGGDLASPSGDSIPVAPVPVPPVPVAPIPVAPIPVPPIPVAPIPVEPVPVPPIPVAPIPVEPVPVAPIPVAPVPQAVPLSSLTRSSESAVPKAISKTKEQNARQNKPFTMETPDFPRQSANRRTGNRGKSQKMDPTTIVVIFLMILLGLILVLFAVSQNSSGPRPTDSSSTNSEETTLLHLPEKLNYSDNSKNSKNSDNLSQTTQTREVVSEPPGLVKPPQLVASDFNALIATAGQDGKVRLWIPRTGKQIRSMDSDQSGTSCVAFSPDGQFLLSGGSDQLVHLWKAMDGSLVQDFVGHSDKITDLSYSPTGKVILSSSLDGTVCVWETEFGVLMKTFRDSGAPILSAVWSPDGRTIAVGDEKGRINIWDVESGQIVSELAGHKSAIREIRYDSSGKRLASGSDEGLVCLWDADKGKKLESVHPGMAPIQGLAFSHDGLKLAVCGQSELIQIYSCSEISKSPILTFHTGRKDQTALDWSSDGRYILTSGSDGLVCIYDAASGNSLGKLQTKLGAINDAQFFNETLGSDL